ncbi:MAG: uracil-DNA glycosylase [Treponema sp.]|nr:uracil-DNA glycosylase [Treponema sp.]
MKAQEKELIYNLLKTADAYNSGYVRTKFAQEYEFLDDEEGSVSQELTSSSSISESPSPDLANPSAAPIQTPQESPAEKTGLSSGYSMEELSAKILRCTRCGLARTRNNVVPGEGVSSPLVLVIGEGPGYEEDMQGRPFVGKAGALLDKMLAAIQLDRKTNAYIANIVKCRPPENRNPFPDEQDACFSFLEAQIHLLKPKMILCMGKIAIEKLMNQSVAITHAHGQFFEYQGIPVMPTFHPSALLRNPDLKRPAWEDLKKFKSKLDEIS